MEEKKKTRVETTTLERVPPEEKRSWLSIAFIWAGNVICVPALMVGGMVVSGLTFAHAAAAMLLGFTIVVLYMMPLAATAAQLGVPATVAISRAYGSRGSGVAVSLVIAVSSVGWFGYQTYICASSFCAILATYAGVDFPMILSCLLWGGAMLATAIYGIRLIKVLNLVSVPALFLFLIYGLAVVLGEPGAVTTLLDYMPPGTMPMITGITMAVGGFSVGAVISGDYTRYCKTGKGAAASCVLGVIPCGVGVLIIGSILAICTGSYDITVMFAQIGLPIFGLVVLILATWTTNTGNAYSAGIATVNIFKLADNKRALATAVCGIIGILLSMGGIINYFVAYLSLLSVFIPPVAGAALADYWILGKGRAEGWKPVPGVNWIGIVSWVCGVAVAYFSTFFIPAINGIVVSCVLYLILMAVIKNPKYNPFEAMKAEQGGTEQ